MAAERAYLTRSEAASYLGMGVRTFARTVAPKVPRYCPNGARPKYRREDLDAFMQGGLEVPPQADTPKRQRARGKRSLDRAVASNALAASLLKKLEGNRAA